MKRFQYALTLTNPILFFLMSACLLIGFVETAQPTDKALDESNFGILGLIIGDCAPRDVYSKFGPGIAFKDAAQADVSQVCYISDRDETLILFSTKSSKCTGFKMMSQKKRFYKWHFCEKSSLVSKHLTTGSGIKLGMSRNQLKAILGPPERESNSLLNYVFDRDRKTTIRAEFSDAGLISFDLLKIKQ